MKLAFRLATAAAALLTAAAILALLPSADAAAAARGRTRKCADCHVAPQPHFGDDCHDCHSASRFTPTKKGAPPHPVPLVGRHIVLACTACHKGARPPATACAGCHAAPKEHLAGECQACHTPKGWFAAAGVRGPDAPHAIAAADTCGVCHDPAGHNWPAPAGHKAYRQSQCRLCHAAGGKASVTVRHDPKLNLLRGKHASLQCVQCHAAGQFAGTPSGCYACHQAADRHAGAFGQDCARCHSPEGWAGATFDHGQTGFPLTGKHASAACARCHGGGVFAGTPTACAACHAEPAYHAGLLGAGCAECHTPDGWQPAAYARPHGFPLDHNGAGGACRACHPDRLPAYTCFGCHNPGKIDEEHREHGIGDYSNCVACHPDGHEP